MFFAFLLDVPEGQNARLMSRPMTSLALVMGFYELSRKGTEGMLLVWEITRSPQGLVH